MSYGFRTREFMFNNTFSYVPLVDSILAQNSNAAENFSADESSRTASSWQKSHC